MKQIRQGQFETNSSSTHVFCISNDGARQKPVDVKMSEIKDIWSMDDGTSFEKKVACLYSITRELGLDDQFLNYLSSRNINIIHDGDYSDISNGFGVFKSEKEIDNYLFNAESKSEDIDNNYAGDVIDKYTDKGYTVRRYDY